MNETFRARVKPLEWEDSEDESTAYSKVEYRVVQGGMAWRAYVPDSDGIMGCSFGHFASRQAAKDKCEADNIETVKALLIIEED